MSHDVCTSVRAIMASFVDGFAVTTSLRNTHKKRRKHDAHSNDRKATNALSKSLQQSPRIIGEEYENALRHAGPQFAQGDGIASIRLNEILLRLNTGLVNIIAGFLSDRSRAEPELDYRSLTVLSERARHDSVGTLHQLYQRLMSRRLPAIMPSSRMRASKKRENHTVQRGCASASPKIRGPTIAQVTIEDSAKRPQLAVVKPSANSSSSSRKKLANGYQSQSYRPSAASSSTTLVQSSSQLTASSKRVPHVRSTDRLASHSRLRKQVSTSAVAQLPRQQNQRTVPPSRSQPNLLVNHSPVAIPPIPAATTRLRQPMSPKRSSPTLYSIATDSTKLGEIPVHKRTRPYDFEAMSMLNRDAIENGWPVRDLDGELLVRPKKRFGWFGLRRLAAS